MWTNITDEDIEKADDEVMSPDEGMGGLMGMGGDEPPEAAGASEKGGGEQVNQKQNRPRANIRK